MSGRDRAVVDAGCPARLKPFEGSTHASCNSEAKPLMRLGVLVLMQLLDRYSGRFSHLFPADVQ
jgi:hypothetical protein